MDAAPQGRRPQQFLTGWRRVAVSVAVLLATVVAWSVCTLSVTRTDDPVLMVGPEHPELIRSVVYSVPNGTVDEVYVRSIDGGPPRLLARLSFAFSFRAQGSASPDGTRVAIVSVPGVAASGQISIWPLGSGQPVRVQGEFEYLTGIAWRPDGSRLAAVGRATPDESGRITAEIIEVDVESGDTETLSAFERVNNAVPVGYTPGGNVLVVTIDQGGSTLWVIDANHERRVVATLSSGKTRDWALSPDGARLAYIDRSGNVETDNGHILTLATGQIALAPGEGHVGVAWIPGTDIPVFGGPRGGLGFTDPDEAASGAYIVPVAWSPDGTALVAEVYESIALERANLVPSLELVTRDTRALVAEDPGVRFFGWVVNPDQDGGAGE